jgi:hypothetical protein
MVPRSAPQNAAASWSLGLGLLAMALVLVYWPLSPLAAVAAIVTGVRGRRAGKNGFGGETRAVVGALYGVIALVALGVVLILFYVEDFAG